jgi:hypothetical protein
MTIKLANIRQTTVGVYAPRIVRGGLDAIDDLAATRPGLVPHSIFLSYKIV